MADLRDRAGGLPQAGARDRVVIKLLSHLKSACTWLDLKFRFDPDTAVSKFNSMLLKLYPATGPGRLMVGLRLLKRIYTRMLIERARLERLRSETPAGSPRLAQNAAELDRIEFSWTVFNTHHQCLLRNKELRNLTRSQAKLVTETDSDESVHRFVHLALVRTKGNAGTVFRQIPERDDDRDVYSRVELIMREHAARDALLPSDAARKAALDLPFFDMKRMGYPPSAAGEAVTGEIRRWLVAIGFPPGELVSYVCHSLRHGGASDMLDSGIAQDVVAKHGRWASLVWFEVYRHLSTDARLAPLAAASAQARDKRAGLVLFLIRPIKCLIVWRPASGTRHRATCMASPGTPPPRGLPPPVSSVLVVALSGVLVGSGRHAGRSLTLRAPPSCHPISSVPLPLITVGWVGGSACAAPFLVLSRACSHSSRPGPQAPPSVSLDTFFTGSGGSSHPGSGTQASRNRSRAALPDPRAYTLPYLCATDG